MRAVFIGAGSTAQAAARKALEEGHDVVVVEKDAARVEALSEELDCGFVNDDGSRPATLKELGPENTDVLFCLTNRDHDNILAGLVAQSLGYERVVVKVHDLDLEPLCAELGLKDVLVPSRKIGYSLVDLLEGREPPELSSVLRGGWRFWGFTAGESHTGSIESMELPERARVIAVTRDEETRLAEPTLQLEVGDHVLLLAHEDELEILDERFEA